MNTERNWDVLLIGGSSGSGKSTIAYELGCFYQVNVIKVDDLEQAVKALTTAETLPMLHYWDSGKDWHDVGVAGNVEWLMNVSDEISPAIKAVVENVHLADSEPCIIEGDFIHPKLCAAFTNARVKSVFVKETDSEHLLQNFMNREGTHQPYRAEISYTHGCLLEKLCSEYSIPVVAARPWNSLMERVIAVLKAKNN
jgi:2-phosphoglycerate kinase